MSDAMRIADVPDRKVFKEMEKEALRLKTQAEKSYLDLAEVLAGIRGEFRKAQSMAEAKREFGFETFDGWVEGSFGWKRRKALYLIAVWEKLHVAQGIPKGKIAEIEWTKAAALSRLADSGHLTKENVDKWADRAKEMGVDKLETVVTKTIEAKGTVVEHSPGNGEVPVREIVHVVRLGLYDGQYKNWLQALKTAAKMLESDKLPHLVDMICLEFNATHHPADVDREIGIARICARVEELFEVKLVVIDPKSSEVLHGQDVVKSL